MRGGQGREYNYNYRRYIILIYFVCEDAPSTYDMVKYVLHPRPENTTHAGFYINIRAASAHTGLLAKPMLSDCISFTSCKHMQGLPTTYIYRGQDLV